MIDFDLNLLRVFNLLYEEGSVTRAATRLHLTQSAVSHSLARLREVLDDPLFVKVANGLRPTERAHQLAPRLRVAFADIRSVVHSPVFDPASSSRHFRMAANTYFNGITFNLIGLLRRQAPNVTLQVTDENLDLTDALDQQLVDIVLSGFDKVPSRFRSEVIFQDEMVWVIGADNPLAARSLDQKTLLAQPRLGIATALLPERASTPLRDRLVRLTVAGLDLEVDPSDSLGQSRRMLVYDVDAAIAVVAASDMVALVPRSYASIWANFRRIKMVELPKGRLKPVDATMTWHSRFQDEPGSVWLRQLVRDAVKVAVTSAQCHRASRSFMEFRNSVHNRQNKPKRSSKAGPVSRVSK